MDSSGAGLSSVTRRDVVAMCAIGSVGIAGFSRGRGADRSARRSSQDSGALIKGGRVVNSDGVRALDVRVRDETIVQLGSGLAQAADERLFDATDKLVIPGGIDPHTHLQPSFVDDLTTGTAAAVAGGITTVGTFAFAGRDETAMQAVERMSGLVNDQAIGDVILHAHVWPPTSDYIDSMRKLAERGQPSIKIFMPRNDFGQHEDAVIQLLEEAATHGVVVMMHCEDQSVLSAAIRRLQAEGRTSLRSYAESRPEIAEVIATQRAVGLCELTGAPMHIVHLSSARALDACRNEATFSLPLTIETRPLYLHFTAEQFAEPNGPLYLGQPPLRDHSDLAVLWQGLADGRIDMLATDHAPWTRAQKLDPELSITRLRPGVSDLRFMLPIYFSEGVRKGRVTLESFVATTSTNAAKAFGLYPRKGVIQVGSQADLVVFDPAKTDTVRASDDPSNSDYTVFEGWSVTGWPETVMRRGEVVYDDGRVVGVAGSGSLAARDPRR